MKPLPPPPNVDGQGFKDWLFRLWALMKELGDRLDNLPTPEGGTTDHSKLTNLNSTTHTHLTQAQATALTSGGVTSLHTHPAGSSPGDFANNPALLALSGVVPAADTVPYFTSASAAAVTGLTAYSRTLLDDTTAGAWRTTLGLGTMAVETATDYLSKAGNLSGLNSAATARSNLGLGTMATETAADFLTKTGNLAGLSSAATSRTNIGLGSADAVTFGSLSVGVTDIQWSTDVTGALLRCLKNNGGSAVAVSVVDDRGFSGVNSGASFEIKTWNTGDDTGDIFRCNSFSGSDSYVFRVRMSGAVELLGDLIVGDDATITGDLAADTLADAKGDVRTIPQNSKSAAYTTVLADAGKHILHPSADTTARVFTIDSNANVPYPVGTAITFVNQDSAGAVTISITSDTMRLAGSGATGSRTLAANGIATALKVTSTEWLISGTNLV